MKRQMQSSIIILLVVVLFSILISGCSGGGGSTSISNNNPDPSTSPTNPIPTNSPTPNPTNTPNPNPTYEPIPNPTITNIPTPTYSPNPNKVDISGKYIIQKNSGNKSEEISITLPDGKTVNSINEYLTRIKQFDTDNPMSISLAVYDMSNISSKINAPTVTVHNYRSEANNTHWQRIECEEESVVAYARTIKFYHQICEQNIGTGEIIIIEEQLAKTITTGTYFSLHSLGALKAIIKDEDTGKCTYKELNSANLITMVWEFLKVWLTTDLQQVFPTWSPAYAADVEQIFTPNAINDPQGWITINPDDQPVNIPSIQPIPQPSNYINPGDGTDHPQKFRDIYNKDNMGDAVERAHWRYNNKVVEQEFRGGNWENSTIMHDECLDPNMNAYVIYGEELRLYEKYNGPDGDFGKLRSNREGIGLNGRNGNNFRFDNGIIINIDNHTYPIYGEYFRIWEKNKEKLGWPKSGVEAVLLPGDRKGENQYFDGGVIIKSNQGTFFLPYNFFTKWESQKTTLFFPKTNVEAINLGYTGENIRFENGLVISWKEGIFSILGDHLTRWEPNKVEYGFPIGDSYSMPNGKNYQDFINKKMEY